MLKAVDGVPVPQDQCLGVSQTNQQVRAVWQRIARQADDATFSVTSLL
jgi:N-glycosylase/DNA lyase